MDKTEKHLMGLAEVTRGLNQQIEYLMSKLEVNYTVAVENKITVATLSLTNWMTKQKYTVAIGSSEVFFEEKFDKALGEKYAYEDAIKKARKFLEDSIFFHHFMKQNYLGDDVTPIKNI